MPNVKHHWKQYCCFSCQLFSDDTCFVVISGIAEATPFLHVHPFYFCRLYSPHTEMCKCEFVCLCVSRTDVYQYCVYEEGQKVKTVSNLQSYSSPPR